MVSKEMLLHAIALGGESGLPSMATGCIRDIHVPHPSGGGVVQIGYPADLSGNPCRNDEQEPVSIILKSPLAPPFTKGGTILDYKGGTILDS